MYRFQRHLGKFVLQQYNVYNPFSGVTNNQAESFFQRWKKVIVLALYNLQAYYNNEIGGGFEGIMTAAC